jgi:hypothetical protein
MSKIFNFKNQLNVGNVGENLFIECYKNAQKTDGRVADFIMDGKTIELKTDTYSMDNTPNFFMERYGNIQTFADGGPWRAKNDNLDFFVYMFLNQKTFFWFEPNSLCGFLDKYILDLKPKTIDNRTWAALGYAVSREACKDYIIKVDKF